MPLRRRYWEVVTADGRNLVAYRDLVRGRWYTHVERRGGRTSTAQGRAAGSVTFAALP